MCGKMNSLSPNCTTNIHMFMKIWLRNWCHYILSYRNIHPFTELLAWASYQVRKIASCACTGNAMNVFPATAGKRTRHVSRHVRHARAVMHAGIAD